MKPDPEKKPREPRKPRSPKDVDGQMLMGGDVVREKKKKPKPEAPRGPIPLKHRVFNLHIRPGELPLVLDPDQFIEEAPKETP